MPDVLDFKDRLRRVLHDRGDAIQPQLTVLDIRRHAASGGVRGQRFGALLSAAAVAATALVLVLVQGTGSHGEGQPPFQPAASATPAGRPADIVAGCTRPPDEFGDGLRYDGPATRTWVWFPVAHWPAGTDPLAIGRRSFEAAGVLPPANATVVVGPANGATFPRVVATPLLLNVGDKIEMLHSGQRRVYEVIDREGYTEAQGVPSAVFSPSDSEQLALITCGGGTEAETPNHDHIVVVHARPVH
jgi:hypothetical protein